jgi:hypothetical protein
MIASTRFPSVTLAQVREELHLHGFPPGDFVDHLDVGGGFLRIGKKRAGRSLDGREHSRFPEPRP